MVAAGAPINAFDQNDWVGYASLTADSATWNATESASLHSVTFSEVSGEEYLVMLMTNVSADVAADAAIVRIRLDTAAGTQIGGPQVYLPTTSTVGFGLTILAKYTSAATGSKTIHVTGQRNSGTGTAHRIRAAGARPTLMFVIRLNS